MHKKIEIVVMVVLFVVLLGCRQVAPLHNTSIADIHTTLEDSSAIDRTIASRANKKRVPQSVNAALMPERRFVSNVSSEAKRFNIAVQEVPAKTFFAGLVKGSSYNIVVSPQVQGNISLDLKNVTVEEVLETVRDMYGFEYKRMRSGFEILPNTIRTQVFNVDYLNMSRSGETSTAVSSGQPTSMGGMSTTTNNNISTSTNNANNVQQSSMVKTKSLSSFWKGMEETLTSMVGDEGGRSVMIQPDAGTVVVRADNNQLREVREYLSTIQRNMNRQVILEAKILEVELNDQFQSGINWHLLGLQQGADFTGATSDFKGIFALKATAGGAFSSVIRLLSQEGNVQVLSSPRISTVNNQKAVIKVGTDEFFVTGVTTSTLAGTGSTDTTQNVNMAPFFSGIALDVTPEIDDHNNVILHIHPSVSDVKQKEIQVTIGKQQVNLPSAQSAIRETDSIVRAANGQVIVVGGLMQNKMSETLKGTPYAGRLPVIGTLFRDTQQQSTKSELVLLLRPVVVTPKTWSRQMDQAGDRFDTLDRGFHNGSRSEVFGNLGEDYYG